jgi:hypothetical protein
MRFKNQRETNYPCKYKKNGGGGGSALVKHHRRKPVHVDTTVSHCQAQRGNCQYYDTETERGWPEWMETERVRQITTPDSLKASR